MTHPGERSGGTVTASRVWRRVAAVAVPFVMAIILIRLWAAVWLDSLWYRSVGHHEVFVTRYGTAIALALAFTLFFFVACAVNTLLARRFAPEFIAVHSDDELLYRYHYAVGEHQGVLLVGLSAVLAAVAGLPAAAVWQDWLLFTNGRGVGVGDAQFQIDLGFYLFRLPFLGYASSWILTALVTITILTAMSYYLNGGIRWRRGSALSLTSAAKAHLSVLAATIALLKGATYYFVDRPALTLARNRVFDGAGYTAVNAKLPALMLLVLVSVFSAAFLIFNVWRRGFSLPLVALSLWAVVAVVAGVLYPAVVQRFKVDPNKAEEEVAYIRRNQAATMSAYGMDGALEVTPFDAETKVSAEDAKRLSPQISRTPVLDPALMPATFRRLESENVQTFVNVDLDRYTIDGEKRAVVIGAREIRRADIPSESWEQAHLVYTHAKGIAVAPADETSPEGRPLFFDQAGVAAKNAGLALDRDEVYFGESFADWYAIVNSSRATYDKSKYTAKTGIRISSFWRKLALAIHAGDVDPLVTSYITSDSQVLMRRDVRERVRALAPFLSLTSDPYPVVLGGRLMFVVDAFTTSATYPYSQYSSTDGLYTGPNAGYSTFNYLRNPVKATVDAYDGTVHLYRIDKTFGPSDPIVEAWSRAFPRLFEDFDDMPDGLADHLRYPDEQLSVQSSILGRYHEDDPATFYDGSQNWVIARNPGDRVAQAPASGAASVAASDTGPNPSVSEFIRVPPGEDGSFVKLLPFTPGTTVNNLKPELTGFVVAGQDPDDYGDLRLFEVTQVDAGSRRSGAGIDGPNLAQQTIGNEPDISKEITLLNGNGSAVRFGTMTLMPVGNSVVWVRPLYVMGSGGEDSFPNLRKVIVVAHGQAEMADTLTDALNGLLDKPGDAADANTGDEPKDPAELLAEAGQLLDEGQAALSDDGGLAVYQRNQNKARKLIGEALALINAEASSTTTSAPPAVPTTAAPGNTSTPTTAAAATTVAPAAVSSTTPSATISTTSTAPAG